MEVSSFEKIAPYLKDPLVLIGFFLVLFFGLGRALIRSGLIRPLNGVRGYRILRNLLLFGFLLGVLVIALGFGLKYRELSQDEQVRAIALLAGEFEANAASVEALRKNTMALLGVMKNVAELLRRSDVPVLAALFPMANITSGSANTPRELAIEALERLVAQRLDRNPEELKRADTAARAIRNTIQQTRPTVLSLTDREHVRFPISEKEWRANESILRRIRLPGVSDFQQSYASTRQLRNDYDVICESVVAYLDSLNVLFSKNSPVDVDRLTAVLTQERQSFALVTAYGESATTAIGRIKLLQKENRSKRRMDHPADVSDPLWTDLQEGI